MLFATLQLLLAQTPTSPLSLSYEFQVAAVALDTEQERDYYQLGCAQSHRLAAD